MFANSKPAKSPKYPKPPKPNSKSFDIMKWLLYIQSVLNYNTHHLNNSKLFAGAMIIILNVASKFVTVKLSKSMESYLKYTFSRDLLIFAIAWMGTRDIYIALMIVIVFIICMDFLFNEDSAYCILPESFIEHHQEKMQNELGELTEQDIQNIKNIASKIEKIHSVGNTGTSYTSEEEHNDSENPETETWEENFQMNK
jgi:hypothetical protein